MRARSLLYVRYAISSPRGPVMPPMIPRICADWSSDMLQRPSGQQASDTAPPIGTWGNAYMSSPVGGAIITIGVGLDWKNSTEP